VTRGWKIALSVAGAILALNLLLLAVRATTGGTPGGPTSSSYATGADGDAALATLLTRAGHRVVRERVTPHAAQLGPGDTAVVLDPPFVLAEDIEALGTFVRDGGRLVASPGASNWLRRAVPNGPVDGAAGVVDAHPLAPLPELSAVRTVEAAGENAWAAARGTLPVVGDARGSIVVAAHPGAGRAWLLADATPLQNAYLGRADNAQLALALVGPARRRVVFFETYHGYGRSSGLAAIPGSWQRALLLAAGAALLFMFARARRLGPPEDDARPFAPARREYVDALAATLARSRDRQAALAPVRDELRARIARRSGLRRDATEDALATAAARLGFSTEEVDAMRHETSPDELALGRAFARSSERGSTWRI
jgi:hypothetical protein